MRIVHKLQSTLEIHIAQVIYLCLVFTKLICENLGFTFPPLFIIIMPLYTDYNIIDLQFTQYTLSKMDILIGTRETRLKILNRHFIPCLSSIIDALATGVFRSTWEFDGEYLFELPLDRENSDLDCVIDWGDGSESQHITRIEDCVHNYEEGVYEIKITGWITGFTFNRSSRRARQSIRKILEWGPVRLSNSGRQFAECSSLEIDALDNPKLNNITNMESMFRDAIYFTGNIGGWDTSTVTNMHSMFSRAVSFNCDIGKWNTSEVTNMGSMFEGAAQFNCDLAEWKTSKVTNMHRMFFEAISFNCDIGGWNTSEVTNMGSMFKGATQFNCDLAEWKTSKVTNMHRMFFEAISFNCDIGGWNTSEVTNMGSMFKGATQFNCDLGKWNTSKVTDMGSMFKGAIQFNGDLGEWETSKVTDMGHMFDGAEHFNGDISKWNTSEVTNMDYMFYDAIHFDSNYTSLWKTSKIFSKNCIFGRGETYIMDYDTLEFPDVHGDFTE